MVCATPSLQNQTPKTTFKRGGGMGSLDLPLNQKAG